MIYPPELLDRLQAITPSPWSGTAYRHMFGSYPPDQQNTRGARWNPPNTAAIYLSLTEAGAIAEGDHLIAMQPARPKAARTVYEIQIELASVIDLTASATLESCGVTQPELVGIDMTACQTVGGATAWLEHDGLLVPSARSTATNLIIYPTNQQPETIFDVLNGRVVD